MPQRPVDLREDRAWLDGYRAGDRAALERVFRTYVPLVMHLLRGGSPHDGPRLFVAEEQEQDDVAQEVFMRLFQESTRRNYDGLRPFATWVRTVTRNTLVDHLRKRGRLKEDTGMDLESAAQAEWIPGQPLPDENLLSREEQQVATALWDSLAADERELAKVRYRQGLSQRDAAEALGISRQNLRTLEARLRRKMEEFLARVGWHGTSTNPRTESERTQGS